MQVQAKEHVVLDEQQQNVSIMSPMSTCSKPAVLKTISNMALETILESNSISYSPSKIVTIQKLVEADQSHVEEQQLNDNDYDEEE